MKRDYAIYQVSFKILLRKGGKVLFLRSTEESYIDLPGGRADNVENKVPLQEIIAREVREELGPKIKYELNKLAFQYRRYSKPRQIYILFTVYKAKYVSGDIKLSPEHNSYEWINPVTYKFDRKDFEGEEEYQAFREYFKAK